MTVAISKRGCINHTAGNQRAHVGRRSRSPPALPSATIINDDREMCRSRTESPAAPARRRRSRARTLRPDGSHEADPFPPHRDRGEPPEHRERPVAETGGADRKRRQHRSRGDAQPQIARRRRGGRLGHRNRWLAACPSIRIRPPPARRSAVRAVAIFGDRLFERGAVEIRPEGRHEDEFAVSRLPQQEIRQPLLAAGADDQIGIGKIGHIEELRQAARR